MRIRQQMLAVASGVFLAIATVVSAQAQTTTNDTQSQKIWQLQRALYELFLYHDAPSGEWDDKTISAVNEWRELQGESAVRHLLDMDYEAIVRQSKETRYWVAIAFSDDGSYGMVSSQDRRHEAENAAYKGCFGTSKTRRCYVASLSLELEEISNDGEAWLSVVLCKNAKGQKTREGAGLTRQDAENAAFNNAVRDYRRDYGFKKEECRLVVTAEAAGAHEYK